jgi:uncharacterized metal-binding protein
MNQAACRTPGDKPAPDDAEYELAYIERTRNVCPMCEDYAKRQAAKPVAVMCCEGACLRGEIARQAANLLCHTLRPEQTVRICLGGAFTKDTGQRALVKHAPRVIALEGCYLNCASRMMRGVIRDLEPEVLVADRLYEFDRQLFGIDELPAADIATHARTVAEEVARTLPAYDHKRA